VGGASDHFLSKSDFLVAIFGVSEAPESEKVHPPIFPYYLTWRSIRPSWPYTAALQSAAAARVQACNYNRDAARVFGAFLLLVKEELYFVCIL
jgi:hypothetical protein